MKRKDTFDIEVTDTFGGEANYCWVRRYQVDAVSILGAIQMVSRREGYNFRADYNDGDFARYDAIDACVCCFINYHDDIND